ncbi:hypothetical protein [Roseiconus lacunae]|uniref:Uncharacterized protein n=1 Tax=Roseiconus lacunae TaxID=2605694 RepID=A0ABT7PSH3_9BACT|nr:hypothetical protein [Roseiconus lacunae]MDM4019431.1 hypothetical protein [Roseiconus lacunae]
MPWYAVGVAIIAMLFLTYGSLAAQTVIERSTGRRPHPYSNTYSAAYFVISFGITLPSIYLMPNLHPVFYGMIFVLASTIGTVTAVSFFGVTDCDRAERE